MILHPNDFASPTSVMPPAPAHEKRKTRNVQLRVLF